MDQPCAVAVEGCPQAPLVKVEGITKSFGGVLALRGVGLDVRPGEVHALLGENGAGKSTLIKILSGVHAHDGGTIEIAGRPAAFTSPVDSRAAGIAVVYQDLSLVESLSVAANLMLGREPLTRLGFLRKQKLMAEAESFLKQHHIPLDPRATVGSLPFAYRQMTEIAKALLGDVRLLILDEPTSSLTGDEVQILFDAIGAVTRRGVGVIYVTHRLDEVFRISQRVTVLRDGTNAGTFATAETDMKRLVTAIVGPNHAAQTALSQPVETTPPVRAADAPVLTLARVSNDRLRGVDLTVCSGEIHGLAGLIGSGRTEILETIFGLRRADSGTVAIGGEARQPQGPTDAIERGIALVPEDRHAEGLVLEHSIERNVTLARLPHFSWWGWMQQRAAARRAKVAIGRLAIKAPGASSLVRTLSGGNQQKVVFAKWSHPQPRVLLLDEPTVGVDVGAREEIYGVIRDAATSGTGVLVVSSDLVELLQLCDRISLVVQGRVTKTFQRGELGNAEELHHLLQLSQAAEPPTSLELSA
ncbi:sugar ABC transporter ATP-binding protein [Bradyrhizobium prioriisuperbiae]|uniref:sugar ABC transporter ATP-binding protein n=1 Tax=Bradyrhizobium prioriisuperbiae TaxID=2854389 RepID=UPI0028E7CC32|nr:sugar ABC transporter ATP-binding protein [Bradyrhizobium prioritasuperba]